MTNDEFFGLTRAQLVFKIKRLEASRAAMVAKNAQLRERNQKLSRELSRTKEDIAAELKQKIGTKLLESIVGI